MDTQDFDKKIREMWTHGDPVQRDFTLAEIAISLHPNLLEIIPANALPRDKWLASQRILLDTPGANLLRLAGLVNMLIFALVVWLTFFTSRSWYILLAEALIAFVLAGKFAIFMRKRAILKGAMSSAYAFDKLWSLQAFALATGGKSYEPTLGKNAWQDVVLLSLGLPDLITNAPQTRMEMLDEVFTPSNRTK